MLRSAKQDRQFQFIVEVPMNYDNKTFFKKNFRRARLLR